MKSSVLEFRNITMQFQQGGAQPRQVLDGVTFDLTSDRSVALLGRSGSGKSTLLHLAAGIQVPTSGEIHLAGQELSALGEKERTRWRSRHLGLVFQFFHLLPHLSVEENVALPGWVAGLDTATGRKRVHMLLNQVGLADRAADPVGKLSGGEMQRVAICRSLLMSPRLVLADEPTGSLDDKTGHLVMDLLLQMVRDEEGALLYVTHSRDLAAMADETWELHDGRLEPTPVP